MGSSEERIAYADAPPTRPTSWSATLVPRLRLGRLGPSKLVLVDQPRGDLVQLDPPGGLFTVEALVLPAELLEQSDSPGSALFLTAGPSGCLAGARGEDVGHVRSSRQDSAWRLTLKGRLGLNISHHLRSAASLGHTSCTPVGLCRSRQRPVSRSPRCHRIRTVREGVWVVVGAEYSPLLAILLLESLPGSRARQRSRDRWSLAGSRQTRGSAFR